MLNTASFQRLRNVKQLGLASLVYPGADYSRFSHSVGVCHVVGRMMERLLRRGHDGDAGLLDLDDVYEIQEFRLAGLLHDVGHYPFSHAAEQAAKNFYAPTHTVRAGEIGSGRRQSRQKTAYDHEQVGAKILELDDELRDAIEEHDYDPGEIMRMVGHVEPKRPRSNVLASDLNGDRLDYLLRSSHFTGLPFGSIDLDYIISQVCEDNLGNACLTPKALRAADHFLISRILDYRQCAYHKTVAAYEWLLQDVIRSLLGLPGTDLDLSTKGVEEMIEFGDWARFTDAQLMGRMQAEFDSRRRFGNEEVAQKAAALLSRNTPAMVGEIEYFAGFTQPGQPDAHLGAVSNVENSLGQWAEQFSIPPALWKVWQKTINLTKIGSHAPWSSRFKPPTREDLDEYKQMVRLAKPGKASRLITDMPQSLTFFLADYNLAMIRVYVVLPELKEHLKTRLRRKIELQIRKDLGGLGWVS